MLRNIGGLGFPSNLRTMSARLGIVVMASSAALSGCWSDSPTEPSLPPPPPVPTLAEIRIQPGLATIRVGETVRLTATGVRDDGSAATLTSVTWTSGNQSVATVDQQGLVTGLEPGTVTIRAASDGVSGSAQLTVEGSSTFSGAWTQVVAGPQSTCALDTEGRLFCWGTFAQVGRVPRPTLVDDSRRFVSIGGGANHGHCAVDDQSDAYCLVGLTPQRVPDPSGGPVRWRQVESGNGGWFCGVTIASDLYCWGDNDEGQLGLGFRGGRRDQPALLSSLDGEGNGSLRGRALSVEVGRNHGCVVFAGTPEFGLACWGSNVARQAFPSSELLIPVPRALGGGVANVATGWLYTCITLESDARGACWGKNSEGQLGAGVTSDPQGDPVLIDLPDTRWTQIATGADHTCGLTDSGQAYCWGTGTPGAIGNGSEGGVFPGPQPISSELRFTDVTVAPTPNRDFLGLDGPHSCGVAVSGALYCWGENGSGQLGDGTTQDRLVPTRVADPE